MALQSLSSQSLQLYPRTSLNSGSSTQSLGVLIVTCRHCDPTARAAGSRASRRKEAATKDKKADARRHPIVIERASREWGKDRKGSCCCWKKEARREGCVWSAWGEGCDFFQGERTKGAAVTASAAADVWMIMGTASMTTERGTGTNHCRGCVHEA